MQVVDDPQARLEPSERNTDSVAQRSHAEQFDLKRSGNGRPWTADLVGPLLAEGA